MKAMIISEEQSVLLKTESILKANGVDCIQYSWLMKALDNLEEIHPALIIVNAKEYPRHWKTLAQFVRTSFSDVKVILFTPEDLDNEENKKAVTLGILFRFSSFEELAARIGEYLGAAKGVSSKDVEISGDSTNQDCEIPTVESILSEDFFLFTVENIFASVTEDFVLYTCDSLFDGLYESETVKKSVSVSSNTDETRSKNLCGSLLKKIQELHLL